MARSVVLVAQPRQAGVYEMPPTAVPPGATGMSLWIDRSQLVSLSLTLTWNTDLSLDAGANWVSIGGGGLDLARSGRAFANYTEPNAGESISGGKPRGFLVVARVDRAGHPYTDFWTTALRGGELVPGFETTNPARQVRAQVVCSEPVTLSASIEWVGV